MDSILLFKKDLDQYKTSELVVLQQYFGLPVANRDDLVWMLAIYQAENNPRGTMRGPEGKEEAESPEKQEALVRGSAPASDGGRSADELDRLRDWARGTGNATIINSIEDAIRGNTVLELDYNNLTELPPEIGQLTHLVGLHLGVNQLTEFPQIGQLENLQLLDLGTNHLTEIPAEIGQLTDLQYLGLNDNQLTELPAEIGQLENLHTLYLSGNQLTELPAEIGQLTDLRVLELHANPLPADTPKTIPELQQRWRERPHTKAARKK